MIKIEFKEAQDTIDYGAKCLFDFPIDNKLFIKHLYNLREAIVCGKEKDLEAIKSITPYIPTQDPMLDRSHILSLLNRSEQEDKLFQEQYKNV